MITTLETRTIAARAWADYRMVLCIMPGAQPEFWKQEGEMPGAVIAPDLLAAHELLNELDRVSCEE